MPASRQQQARKIFYRIAVVIGILLASWGAANNWRHLASLRWPTVQGRILESGLRSSPEGRLNHPVDWAVVTYEYVVNGIPHTSGQIALWSCDLRHWGAADFVHAHPAGTAVTVSYDPAQPDNAVLIPGPNQWLDRLLIFGGLFVTILGTFGHWRISRRSV